MYYVDEKAIAEEEMFDGFYAVCTNLADSPEAVSYTHLLICTYYS